MLSKIPMNRFLLVAGGGLIAWLSSDDCAFTTGGLRRAGRPRRY
jgi:hypothetical protein